MTTRTVLVFLFIVSGASAQTYTVCEALAHLSELNGKQVKIRGVWDIGDTGETLWSDATSCSAPTIRDGWKWRDIISLRPPEGGPGMAGSYEAYAALAKAHRPCKIMATLSGRLETRDHFETKKWARGPEIPVGFGYYVARLSYRQAEDMEAVPSGPDPAEDDMRKRPYAVRVPDERTLSLGGESKRKPPR
jgi:hypothetical protein